VIEAVDVMLPLSRSARRQPPPLAAVLRDEPPPLQPGIRRAGASRSSPQIFLASRAVVPVPPCPTDSEQSGAKPPPVTTPPVRAAGRRGRPRRGAFRGSHVDHAFMFESGECLGGERTSGRAPAT